MLGTPDQPMLEAYTTLGALATATERRPAGHAGHRQHLPQSRRCWPRPSPRWTWSAQGRAILGIGTGWFELEHDQLGYEFGTFTDRFNRLDEALQIILPMLKGERPTFSGKYYRTRGGDGQPALPRPHSADDRRQRREEDNSRWPRGTSTISTSSPASTSCHARSRWCEERCEEIGRDPRDAGDQHAGDRATSTTTPAGPIPEDFRHACWSAAPRPIAEQIKTKVLDAGIDGVDPQHAVLHARR